MKGRRSKGLPGYTLIEAFIVVALIAAIMAVALPALFRAYQANKVQMAARTMSTNLRFIRMAAVKQKINYTVTVRDETDGSNPNSYIVQYDRFRDGSTYDYEKLDTDIPSGVIIDSSSLDSISFDPRGGATAGTILFIGQDSTKYQVTITLAGSVTIDKV
jgi:Tfp pilus assembly protein FimT